MKGVAFLALLVVASAFEYADEWEAWKTQFSKKYEGDEEEIRRMNIWAMNKKYVELHNANADLYGFTTGMNEYADLDGAEFSSMFNGYRQDLSKKSTNLFVPSVSVKDLPDTVNWLDKGYVTAVKNQGQCGSCWAFSTTGSLEGRHFNATGKLVSLSEQNLVDCSTAEGNHGCQGGLMDDGFKYIKENGGIDTEESYPYQAHNEKCRYKSADSGATLSSWVDVKAKSEDDLQVAVATIGPISVAIDASHISFQLYQYGVYHSWFCSQTKLDHGVLVVGYGKLGSKDYWLVKNSWGKSWGMDGYIQMARNRDNACGIATDASYPVV